MTYIYAHFFSNGDKYVGISNNPEQRWKEGFDSIDSRQYNHKVLIANEKYDKISLVISEDLPRRIAETMEAILVNNFDDFNLNIKKEIMPNLHGNEIVCIYNVDFSHVYPQIDGEVLYYSTEIEENNFFKLMPFKEKVAKEEWKSDFEKVEKKKTELRKLKEMREKKEGLRKINSEEEIHIDRVIERERKKDREFEELREKVTKGSGRCYVATYIYGSYDCPEVWALRRFRDNVLDNSSYGKIFIKIYYAISPTLVKWLGNKKWFKNIFKSKLDKLVVKLQKNGVKSTYYSDK